MKCNPAHSHSFHHLNIVSMVLYRFLDISSLQIIFEWTVVKHKVYLYYVIHLSFPPVKPYQAGTGYASACLIRLKTAPTALGSIAIVNSQGLYFTNFSLPRLPDWECSATGGITLPSPITIVCQIRLPLTPFATACDYCCARCSRRRGALFHHFWSTSFTFSCPSQYVEPIQQYYRLTSM